MEYYNDIPSQFPLGKIVMSEGVSDIFESNDDFAKFVEISLCRYASKDWGNTCKTDRKLNEQALKENDKPTKKWDEVTTKLSDICTSKTHYVMPPENHIVIDFDLSENGEKSLEKNLEAANKWVPTYAEVSKGGSGLHLHYIYTGDASKLSRV